MSIDDHLGSQELMSRLQYISWINDGVLAWTIQAAGMGPDPIAEISARPVPQEPMVRMTLVLL